jgi:hypothetical protein
MKLHIPDIGDTLTLESDWTFPLYEERRNHLLLGAITMQHLGHPYDKGNEAVSRHYLDTREDVLWEISTPLSRQRVESCGACGAVSDGLRMHQPCPACGVEVRHIKHVYPNQRIAVTAEMLGDRFVAKKEKQGKTYGMLMTLSAGTVLTVDRIYIRKGASDFSSLSFFIQSTPTPELAEAKKTKFRFWASLEDVNHMECVAGGPVPDSRPDFTFYINGSKWDGPWKMRKSAINRLEHWEKMETRIRREDPTANVNSFHIQEGDKVILTSEWDFKELKYVRTIATR